MNRAASKAGSRGRFKSIRARLTGVVSLFACGLATLVIVLSWVDGAAIYAARRDELKSITEVAYKVIEQQYEEFASGKLTENEAKERAKNAVRHLRYDVNGYFFVLDDNVMSVVHGGQPTREGTDAALQVDSTGKHPNREMRDLAVAQGEGFVDYLTPKSGSDMKSQREALPKVSFVKRFAPWGWSVGTGVYLDEVAAQVRRNVILASAIGLAFLILIGSVAAIVIFRLTKRLDAVSTAIVALARGDSDVLLPPVTSGDEIGELATAVHIFKDNAVALKISHSEISRLANLDSLTDLPNRRQFFSKLHEMLRRPTGGNQRFVVGVADLDGFKSVNDLYGHTAGDSVLIEAGRRMREISDDTISFWRLGGDEFGVIVDADLDDSEIQALGDRLCKALQVPFALSAGIVEVSGSIGFAVFPGAGSTAELLYERADYALYYAKQHHRGRPAIFSIEHETEIRRFAKLERCLRNADIESEISLYFQPVVDVERGKTVSFEALARWDSPALGRVAPDIFIRVAERSDLINKLTRMLLRRALAEAKTWPHDIRISFNLSMRDLGSREAIVNIVAIIENSGLAPNRIDLEVTETALIQDFDQAIASLRTLKSLGVGVSLDDFGTGYSSLSYVRRFPIDRIKIDRSFVREVETDDSCRAIVKSVIDMSRNLKLGCIVEGMETDNQVRILRSLGGTTMQGYFFSKPMPGAVVLDFLATTNSSWHPETLRVHALVS